MHRVLILNGPNLNLLGTRQTDIYGQTTLTEIEQASVAHGEQIGLKVSCDQSNHEGHLIDAIHGAKSAQDGIILNAGAYTHSSIALMDAVKGVALPVIELHLSNIHAREEFRQRSFIAPVALGQICGFGPHGYLLALDAMKAHLEATA